MEAAESDIRIDTEGIWYYRGAEMTRRDIVGLLCRHLGQDPGGGYFVRIGAQCCPLNVEDTPLVVWAVDWAGAGGQLGARLLLSDSSVEDLDPGTLRVGAEHVLYCRVKNGLFEARFSRPGYYRIAERIGYDSRRGAYFLELSGGRHYIAGGGL